MTQFSCRTRWGSFWRYFDTNQRKKIHEMTLEKVLAILQKEPGEKIKLTVKREDHLRKFTFRLQSFFSSLSYN